MRCRRRWAHNGGAAEGSYSLRKGNVLNAYERAQPDPYARRAASGRGGSFRPLLDRANGPSRLEAIIDVDPKELGEAVACLLLAGRGILFSPTGDRGALGVILYDGDDRSRAYCATRDEFGEVLDRIRALGRPGLPMQG